jgi:hypothetical protein
MQLACGHLLRREKLTNAFGLDMTNSIKVKQGRAEITNNQGSIAPITAVTSPIPKSGPHPLVFI